ncbi:GGDEF domain-containing phosphodiesterase [Palleronia sp. LCG004]|uniref:GGDEF domain-containing phosphodiesterase n=1 Tax=Palleronia sp. LCG004 TaxID=3079304 RepID=UPI002943BBBA|nr:GGDEF domain-containing phosphodiesterase [Palleronia sp. LCG004]WOI56544.1 GGDEF domain-containing phosphodiesterase [Palleronia sp. LCG004]
MPSGNSNVRYDKVRIAATRIGLIVAVVLAGLASQFLGELAPLALSCVIAAGVVAVLHLTWPTPPATPSPLPGVATVTEYLDQTARLHGGLPGVIVLRPTRASGGRATSGELRPGDLAATGAALKAALRPEDVVAEIDGATLAVVLSMRARASLEEIIQIALRLQRCLQAPISCPAGHARFEAAIGICGPSMPDIIDGHAALAAAQVALRNAEADVDNPIRMAARSPDSEAPLALQLAKDLDEAFATGQIIPFFQPQVSTDTGQLTGLEALARWIHPVHGALAPGHFLPTIEAAGAQLALTDAILAQSLKALADWDGRGLDIPHVSINLTQADLNDPSLVDRVEWMLDRHGIAAQRLGIEVLETVLSVKGADKVPQSLSALRQLGCRIDLDDFGTGQASIASIRRFCIDRIKIDRSFVCNLDRDPEQQGMVAAIVTMAEHLSLEVVAEGIETTGEHARAAELGCNQVQGYGIGRPMRIDAVETWLARWRQERLGQAMPAAMRGLTGPGRHASETTGPRGRGRGKTA